ncbi:MAG: serine hydrolase domain-containing protein [Bacteroidia bacterium]|nr:serine hydrolase domain-containing protein [Bacteroidia bacterium]
MNLKPLFPLLTALLLSSCQLWRVAPDTAAELQLRLDSMATVYTRHLPFDAGVAMAVVADGEAIAQVTRGTAVPMSDSAVHAQTLFPLASASKMITAIAVMQAIESGQLRLDQPAAELVDSLPAAWQEITVEQLLNHQDGIADGYRHPEMDAMEPSVRERISRRKYLEFAADLPPRFAPGAKTAYGQTGFVLLSMVLESVYGQPFEEMVESRIFGPAGMERTYFATWSTRIGAYVPAQYEADGDSYRTVRLEYTYPDYATAAITSCLEDLIKLMQALHNRTLLSEASLERLWAGPFGGGDFSYGMERITHRGEVSTGHSGGWSVVLSYLHRPRMSVISISNISDQKILRLGYHATYLTIRYAQEQP